MRTREIKLILKSKPVIEGAGVHLHRAIGHSELPKFDPFLLFDDFSSGDPSDFIKGFPWHPHRGIETITYLLGGKIEHGDSLGNSGVISEGDVQWMTAGSGIIHQEMPVAEKDSILTGFQIWLNLPASHKMTVPRYQSILSYEIPEIILDNCSRVKLISGSFHNLKGPVEENTTKAEYLDVKVPVNSEFIYPAKPGFTVFVYVIEGEGYFSPEHLDPAGKGTILLYDDGDKVIIHTKDKPVRFLLLSGKPLGEPIAWYGPIVMNTDDEIEKAFDEYKKGTFIKHK